MIEFIVKLSIFSVVLSIWFAGFVVLLVIGCIVELVNRNNPDAGTGMGVMIRDWSRSFDAVWRML